MRNIEEKVNKGMEIGKVNDEKVLSVNELHELKKKIDTSKNNDEELIKLICDIWYFGFAVGSEISSDK